MRYYYHYTSVYNAQGILAAGRIRPGLGGVTYLSDRLYNSGAEASNNLGVGQRAIEVCFAIPVDEVTDVVGPEPAAPWNGDRTGGGPEYTTRAEIDAGRSSIVLLRLP